MRSRRRPTILSSIVHYHQMPGTQPLGQTLSKEWEIVEVVTSGRGWVYDSGKWVEVLPGAVLWHIQGDDTIGRSDPEAPYSCFAIRMDGGACERHVPRFSYWPDVAQAIELAEETIGMFLNESIDRQTLLDYLYSKIRYEVLAFEHRRERSVVPEPLKVVKSMIESRYSDPLKVNDLAKAAGWSVAHLHERFRGEFGVSPRQMILDRRLRSAREHLVGTGFSIKEIAAKTGFTHSATFCSTFKKLTGMTPKAYRDSYYFGK
ncbi:helix-turn-helix transcriptional regulator [Puniceicoccaceae bacterium K14]|nr:helix-turn-helix transcriptional regulator [Puniceicoccaceae bacterium K14]